LELARAYNRRRFGNARLTFTGAWFVLGTTVLVMRRCQPLAALARRRLKHQAAVFVPSRAKSVRLGAAAIVG